VTHTNLSKQEPYAFGSKVEAEHERNLRNEVLLLCGEDQDFALYDKTVIAKDPDGLWSSKRLFATARADSENRLSTLGWFRIE
jgi:hypothetical protein